MMVARPADAPDTMPVVRPTLAIEGAPLVHVPPGAGLPSTVVLPWHTDKVPVIAPGDVLTVTFFVA